MDTLIDQVTHRVRAEGGRMTSQRRLILDALDNLSGHPTAEEIFEYVRNEDDEINLSTVYRTLRWLEENGFVSPRWFEDDGRRERFDPIGQNVSTGDHFHFRCRVCNRIIEFDEPLLENLIQDFANRSGSTIESVNLTCYGICANCKESGRISENIHNT